MTDTEAASTEIIVPKAHESNEPQGLRQLAWFANEVSKSGLFTRTVRQNNQNYEVNLTAAEAFLVMEEGIAMGLKPMQALREISIIESRGKKTTVASYKVLAARIQADPRTEMFTWEGDSTYSRIRAKRRGRQDIDEVRVAATEFDKQLVSRHEDHLEDWLFARALRRLAKRGYEDMVLGIYLGGDADLIDETKVIDVAKVEQQMPDGEKSWPCSADCGGRMFLHSNPKGGVYLRCASCNATDVPPPEVRDLVRGTPEALTIAAQSAEAAVVTAEIQAAIDDGTIEEVMPPAGDDASPAPLDVTPPPSDAPVDAAENEGGASEPAPIEAYHDDPGHVNGSGDAQTGAMPPEPAVAATVTASPSEAVAGDATASPADLPRLAPSEHLRAYLRNNRTATGQRHIAIRDALLDAGWDGKSGISATIDSLSEEAITKLLDTFARPNFGELP